MGLNRSYVVAASLCALVTAMVLNPQTPLTATSAERVPGSNGNVTFCTVPRSDQLFKIEFFDLAPEPIPVDRRFFTYLRGEIGNDVTGLEDAKLQITMSAELAKGDQYGPFVYTIPLTTFARDGLAHLTIRDSSSHFTQPQQPRDLCRRALVPGMNEILTDYWFPGSFLKTGQYTFKIEAVIPNIAHGEDKYLFAFQVVQVAATRRIEMDGATADI